MSQLDSDLAITYLKERNGYPAQYRHSVMDGFTQGLAFLGALSFKQRQSLNPYDVTRLSRISEKSHLEDFIMYLLDLEAKEQANG